MFFPGVWCCTEQHRCKWQGFALHQGLAWGQHLSVNPAWQAFHDGECEGKLIQLLQPCETTPQEDCDAS